MMDTRDKILFDATPMIMAPRFGELDSIAIGQKRFIATAQGIYLEARTTALHIRWLIQPMVLPYGEVTSFIRATQAISNAAMTSVFAKAVASGDTETAIGVQLAQDMQSVEMIQPSISSASSSHVTYFDLFDDDRLILDLHTHGDGPAFFSSTDDASDLSRPGPYIAMVLGRCGSAKSMEVSARIVCAPYLMAVTTAVLIEQGVFA